MRDKNKIFKYLFLGYFPFIFAIPVVIFYMRDNNALIVMDADNSYHITEYTDKERKKQLYEYMARNAVNAFLARNPTGLDHPLMFDAIYRDEAREKALKAISSEFKKFKDYDIHQKPEIMTIKALPASQNTILIKIEGQLIRTYIANEQKSSYCLKFKLFLTLSLNHNLRDNLKYPFTITDYQYKQEVEKDGK